MQSVSLIRQLSLFSGDSLCTELVRCVRSLKLRERKSFVGRRARQVSQLRQELESPEMGRNVGESIIWLHE